MRGNGLRVATLTAANATHDHFKHRRSLTQGGDRAHVSTDDLDPEAGKDAHGSEEKISFGIFLQEIDEHLNSCLFGPDRDRDRTIFWLYFRQGMSTKEIASLPGMALGTKGVGSVIERLKQGVREQVLGREEALAASAGSPALSEDMGRKANSRRNSYWL